MKDNLQILYFEKTRSIYQLQNVAMRIIYERNSQRNSQMFPSVLISLNFFFFLKNRPNHHPWLWLRAIAYSSSTSFYTRSPHPFVATRILYTPFELNITRFQFQFVATRNVCASLLLINNRFPPPVLATRIVLYPYLIIQLSIPASNRGYAHRF